MMPKGLPRQRVKNPLGAQAKPVVPAATKRSWQPALPGSDDRMLAPSNRCRLNCAATITERDGPGQIPGPS